MKNKPVRRMALIAIFAALYVILCLIDIQAGRFKITLAAFVIYFVCFAFPFSDCISCCILGVFVDQLIYGLTPTTWLWMLPPLIRPLIISPIKAILERKGILLDEKKILSISLVIITSLLTTLANTGALYLDSIIMKYDFKAVFIQNLIQALITVATGVFEIFLLFPTIRALRKASFIPNEKEVLKNALLNNTKKKRRR